MNTARKGNARENQTGDLLEAEGYLVASRRHIGGAGDLLAVSPPGADLRIRLIEVKATKTPWSHFGPKDREAMLVCAEQFGAEAELAWWAPGSKTCEFIPSARWP